MKNFSKAEAIRIITDAATEYDASMRNRQFLVAYSGSPGIDFCIVGFKAHNFKHFTGVKSDLSAADFYRKALAHKLSPNDFCFDSAGNAQRKLAVLPQLSRMFFGNALRGVFARSGIRLEADYVIGGTATRIAVAFRNGNKFDVPVSLYCEDVKNLTIGSTKVLAVWRRSFGETDFTENTYNATGINAEDILAQIRHHQSTCVANVQTGRIRPV